jgi:predicted CXXCH cytochrome family protein
MSCLSCHSMHHSDPDDQLSAGMRGNRACLQCHENYVGERLREHTHHPAGSTGSLCYNCHMPHTTYALFKGIRSHRVDSPRVAADVANGKPNACNLCHLDQSLQWTADNLKRWYGRRPPELPKNDRNIAAGVVWLLKGNAATRAITAWHFGWRPAQQASRTVWMAPFLAETLNDSYSAVRMVAGRSLKTLPGFQYVTFDFLAAEPERVRLRDKVLKLWKAQPPARERDPAVPIRPDGTPDAAIIERLLRERDPRPITISE